MLEKCPHSDICQQLHALKVEKHQLRDALEKSKEAIIEAKRYMQPDLHPTAILEVIKQALTNPTPTTLMIEREWLSKMEAVVGAAKELADLMQGVIDGDYEPDSFTLQPIQIALKALKDGE